MVHRNRWLNLALVLALMLGMVPFGGPVVMAAPPNQIEIEPELEAQMRADGSTGYLIYFREKADLSPAYEMDWEARGQFVMQALQETAERSQREVRAYLDAQKAEYQVFWIDNVIVVRESGHNTFSALTTEFPEIEALRARRQPMLHEPEDISSILATLAVEPNLSHVNADDVWGMGYAGQDIVVANIDTGVRYTHDALVNQYRGNLGGGNFDHNYNWWDPYDGTTTPNDFHDHGSHTMGTMVGDDGGANQIGMAPQATWIACQSFEGGSSDVDASLLECGQFMAAPWDLTGANPNADLRPHVVNNSWGDCGQTYDPWYEGVLSAWHAAGIYPVFSNGNASNCSYSSPPGLNTVGNPARSGNVTGVGSTGNSNGAYATHSNWGPTDNLDTINPRGYANLKPQVLAPGTNRSAYGTSTDSTYGGMTGTSMSAPHVAGLVALMWSAAPCLIGDYATTETIIEETATPIPYASGNGDEGPGNVPNHATGWGEINAQAAVEAALQVCGDSILTGTVTDAATTAPLQGARIEASNATETRVTTTDANGLYTMSLFSDTYTVTASLFGYQPSTTSGVELTTGMTTTLDVPLTMANWYTVEGYVTDSATGWPLYASIAIDGFLGDPIWTDPVTGFYSVSLPEGVAYTFNVAAWVAGYLPEAVTVGPLTGDLTQDIELDANTGSCTAPGYVLGVAPFLAENFDSVTAPALPDGWTEVIVSGTTPDWATRTSTSHPSGQLPRSAPNLAFFNSYSVSSGSIRMQRTSGVDLSALSSAQVFIWMYHDTGYTGNADRLQVQASTDNGVTWNNVGAAINRYDGSVGWKEHSVDFSAYTGAGMTDVRLGLLAISAYGNDVHIDDVLLAATTCTAPADGGLVVGHVYDDNTGALLNGAQVVNEGGFTATAVATPDDLVVDDAFFTVFSPSGNQVFTATFTSNYGADVQTVAVVNGETVAQSFYLSAGWLVADPSPLTATVELGQSVTGALNLDNLGDLALTFELQEKEIGYSPSMAGEDILVVQYDTAAAGAMQSALTALGVTSLGVTDTAFRAIPVDDLLEYQAVFYAGAAPVDTLPFLVAYLDAGGALYISDNDFGYYRGTTPFYQTYLQATYNVDNGGDFLTGEDIMAGLDLDISADPYPDDFTVGAEGVRIFKFTTSDYAGGVAVERADYKAIYTSFDFDDIAGADVEIALVERILDFLIASDVPWLATDVITGTIAANDTQPVVVTFDASVPEVTQPGVYHAELVVKNDTPYGKVVIPVAMTVTAPEDWGKIEGTVTGLGYCDVNPAPLEGAVVTIEGSTGMTWTLQTDANGFYELWLEQAHSPLVVTASADPDYQAQQASGVVIVGQMVTVQDFDLRLDAPCLGVNPDSLSVTLAMGDNTTLPLTLTNVGAAALEFEFVEQDTGFIPTVKALGAQPLHSTGGSTSRLPVSNPQIPVASQPRIALADIIQGGGFEDGTPNPYWTEYSLNFGTPLCDATSCGTGGGTAGPNSGAWWTWFGGSTTGDTGYVEQEIVINAGASATLNFWVWVGLEALGASDYMRVTVDGTQIYAADVAVTTLDYVEVTLDMSAFADGSPHMLRFASQTAGDGNICIDDVMLDVAGGGGGGAVAWLFENPISGTVLADTGSLVADITFDAAYVTQPGTYMANLRVISDDPVNGNYAIPVTMVVEPSAALGKLQGTVTGLGYCDTNPAPLAGAEVLVESSTDSWLLTTAADGSYLMWVDAEQSPLTVTASHPTHLSAVATGVMVTAQMTTTQDFALRETTPCAAVTPESLSIQVVLGAQVTLPLTLSNLGAGATTFEISEISGTVKMLDINVPSPVVSGVSRAGAFADSGVASGAAVIGMPSGGPAPETISAAWETMAPLPSGRVFAAVVADDQGYVYVIGGTSDGAASTPTNTNYRYNTATNTWDTMAPMPAALDSIDGAFINGKIYIPGDETTATTYVYDVASNTWGTIAASGGYTSRSQYQVVVIDTDLYVLGGIVGGSASTTEVWKLDTVAGTWSAGVPMQKSRTSFSAAAIDGVIYVAGGVLYPGFTPDMTAEKFDGVAWSYIAGVPNGGGAYTRWSYNADGYGENGLWLAAGRRDADWNVLNHAGYYDPEIDTWTDSPTIPTLNQGRVYMEGDVATDGFFYVIGGRDGAGSIAYDTNERFYVGYAGAGPVDVPWLSEDPITGTVPADAAQVVDVTFTALPTMTLGTYHAALVFKTSDPENPRITVPVTMTIVDPSAVSITRLWTSASGGWSSIVLLGALALGGLVWRRKRTR